MRTLTALAVAGILALTVLPTVTVRAPADASPDVTTAAEGCPFTGGVKADPGRKAPAPELNTEDAAGSGCPFRAGSGDVESIDPARERNQV